MKGKIDCIYDECNSTFIKPDNLQDHLEKKCKFHNKRENKEYKIKKDRFINNEFPNTNIPPFHKSFITTPLVYMALFMGVMLGIVSILLGNIVFSTLFLLLGLVGSFFFWYQDVKSKYVKVTRILSPDDINGQTEIYISFWDKKIANLLPNESLWLNGKQKEYIIDELKINNPIVFNPFTIEPPENATPHKISYMNDTSDIEILNQDFYGGIKPEVVKVGFGLLVITGLLLANISVLGNLMEMNS